MLHQKAHLQKLQNIKKYVFVLLIIGSIGGLAALGIGLAGCLGIVPNLNRLHAIVPLGVGALLLSFCVFSLVKKQDKKPPCQMEVVTIEAPWWNDDEDPSSLPEGWKKYTAIESFDIDYSGAKISVLKGDYYFTYEGKIAIGWHGTYNPPCGQGIP